MYVCVGDAQIIYSCIAVILAIQIALGTIANTEAFVDMTLGTSLSKAGENYQTWITEVIKRVVGLGFLYESALG